MGAGHVAVVPSSHTPPPLGFIFHPMERSSGPWINSGELREGRCAGGPWTGPTSATLTALVLAFLWSVGLAAQETEVDTIADAVPDTAAADSAAADTPALELMPFDAIAADTAAAGPTDTVAADSTTGSAAAAARSLPSPTGAFLRGATIPG